MVRLAILLLLGGASLALPHSAVTAQGRGTLLENLTWVQAKQLLTPSTVVVIPLGAQSKEHGPHLPLNNDWLMAEYLKQRVLDGAEVVIVPTVNYHFFPTLVEYPGTTSLERQTARDLVLDIVRSIARHGPRRFYVLNTGVSTILPLWETATLAANDTVLLRFADPLALVDSVVRRVAKQEGGSHADEIETSVMLYIAPAVVQMNKAVKDYRPMRGSGLTPNPTGDGTYSPSGIWGDPTLATREKGRVVTEAMVAGILNDIAQVRRQPLPIRPRSIVLDSAWIARYVGTYEVRPGSNFQIRRDLDSRALRLQWTGRLGSRELVATSDSTFAMFNADAGAWEDRLVVTRGNDGVVRAVVARGDRELYRATKVQ